MTCVFSTLLLKSDIDVKKMEYNVQRVLMIDLKLIDLGICEC